MLIFNSHREKTANFATSDQVIFLSLFSMSIAQMNLVGDIFEYLTQRDPKLWQEWTIQNTTYILRLISHCSILIIANRSLTRSW